MELIEILKTAVVVVLLPLGRAALTWFVQAYNDQKIEPFEWKKLIATEVRIIALAVGSFWLLTETDIVGGLATWGINLDILITTLAVTIYDLISPIGKKTSVVMTKAK